MTPHPATPHAPTPHASGQHQVIDPHAAAKPHQASRRQVRATDKGLAGPTGRDALIPDREGWIDLAFVVVLMALVLVGFSTGYYGAAWMVAAGVGLALGAVIGWVSVAYRWSAIVTMAALAATYFLIGGPAAVRGDLIGGVVPSLTTFSDLAGAVVHGWKRWLTMLPPVDASGPLLALPFLYALVGTAVLLIVARRRPRHLTVALLALALLLGSIILGTLAPASLILQGLVFAAALVGWLVLRARRTHAPLHNGGGSRARLITGTALIAGSLVAGFLIGPHLPGGDEAEPRTVARTALQPPFDVAQFPSPLAGFRRYTEPNPADLYERELLSVTGLPAGYPLRLSTLDSYDGITWRAAGRADTGSSDPGQAFQQIGSRVATTFPGEEARLQVSVPEGGYTGVWVPSTGAVAGVTFDGPRARTLSDRSWLNIDSGSVIVPDRLQPGDAYAMDVVLPDPPPTELPESVTLASGALAITTDTSFVDRKVDQWAGPEDNAWAKLRAVMAYMSNDGAYTDGGTENSYEKVYLPGHSTARLARFMASEQLAGNDEQYAATLALIANRLGVPARVVMGAVPEEDGVIRGKDVGAWVELKQSNGEWLTILPTHFMPDRNQEPNEQQQQTEQQRVGALVPPPAGVNPPSMLQGPDQAQNATDIKKKRDNPLDLSAWPTWLKWVVLGVVLPVVLLLVAYAVIRWAKGRRRRRHATKGPMAGRLAWVWRDLIADARSYHVPVPASGTRIEQARVIDAALVERAAAGEKPRAARVGKKPAPEHAAAEGAGVPRETTGPATPANGATPAAASSLALAAATTANGAVFGPEEPQQEQVTALLTQADEVRAALRGGATRWQRIWADLDLRPLLARGARSGRKQRRNQRRNQRSGAAAPPRARDRETIRALTAGSR